MSLASAFAACVAGAGYLLAWPEFGLLITGVLAGALVGILPGLGGSATLAMLLPFAISLPPTQAYALLIGVAAVVATTGDLTSILVGIPGEAIAAATVVDGHPMAVRGEAARAIGASLFSSLAGSLCGALVFVLSIPLALVVARAVGSPELLMLALLGISLAAPVAGTSRLKGVIAGGLGLMLATIGLDPMTSTARFTFGQLTLWDGIGPIPVALGLFAIPEIVALGGAQAASFSSLSGGSRLSQGIGDVRRLWRLVLQSSAIGTAVGIIPGVGASVSQWMAYGFASRRAPEGAAFGSGAIEGVIAPSAANNATLCGSLVPALALGLPGGLLSALLLSALIMKGIVPGPAMLIPEAQGGHLTLVFSLIWLLVIANILAVALASVGTGLLIRITRVSAGQLVPFLLVLTFVGAFAEHAAVADLLLTSIMGVLGLVMVRYRWPRAPVLMGIVLGPLAENRLFISMDAYGASWLWRPGVLLIGAVILAGLSVPARRIRTLQRTEEPQTTPATGELVCAAMLVVVCMLVFVGAGSYVPRAAFLPRGVAAVTMATLVAAFVAGPLRVRRHLAPVDRTTFSGAAVAWVPVLLMLIWAFGFVIGAPLGIFLYFVVTAGHTLGFAVLSASASLVFLYAILFRLLGVPFPPGALVAWEEMIAVWR